MSADNVIYIAEYTGKKRRYEVWEQSASESPRVRSPQEGSVRFPYPSRIRARTAARKLFEQHSVVEYGIHEIRVHELKSVHPRWLELGGYGVTADLRLDDRRFRPDDYVVIREWSEAEGYTRLFGVWEIFQVKKDLPGLKKGYVLLVLSLPD